MLEQVPPPSLRTLIRPPSPVHGIIDAIPVPVRVAALLARGSLGGEADSVREVLNAVDLSFCWTAYTRDNRAVY